MLESSVHFYSCSTDEPLDGWMTIRNLEVIVSFVFLILSQAEFGCINPSRMMRKCVENVVSAHADGIILPYSRYL